MPADAASTTPSGCVTGLDDEPRDAKRRARPSHGQQGETGQRRPRRRAPAHRPRVPRPHRRARRGAGLVASSHAGRGRACGTRRPARSSRRPNIALPTGTRAAAPCSRRRADRRRPRRTSSPHGGPRGLVENAAVFVVGPTTRVETLPPDVPTPTRVPPSPGSANLTPSPHKRIATTTWLGATATGKTSLVRHSSPR